MKAFTLNSDSWHFRLANYGERRIWSDEETDICEYTRAVLKGALTMFALGLFIALMAFWVSASLYNIFELVFKDGVEFQPWTVIFLTLSFALMVTTGIVAFKEWYEKRPRKDEPEQEPGFVKLAYRKFKDKTCARIEFKNE
jgi:hypothetical protein